MAKVADAPAVAVEFVPVATERVAECAPPFARCPRADRNRAVAVAHSRWRCGSRRWQAEFWPTATAPLADATALERPQSHSRRSPMRRVGTVALEIFRAVIAMAVTVVFRLAIFAVFVAICRVGRDIVCWSDVGGVHAHLGGQGCAVALFIVITYSSHDRAPTLLKFVPWIV